MFGWRRWTSLSLRTLLLVVLVFSVLLGIFAYKLNRGRQQTAAVGEIQKRGGVVPYCCTRNGRSPETIEQKWFVRLLGNDLFLTYPRVVLRSPSLSEDDVRAMFPYLRRLTPVEGMNIEGKSFIALDVIGNPNLSEPFIAEMRRELPNCEFSKVTAVPNEAEEHIDVGMSGSEVVTALGEIMLRERSDWVWDTPADRQRCVRQLGNSHKKYLSSEGLATWTFFADDIGVAVLGIDFDDRGRVTAVWHDRGSPPPSRGLSAVPMPNGDSYQ